MAKKKKEVELKEVSRTEINGAIIIKYEDGSVKIIPAPIMLSAEEAEDLFGSESDDEEEEEEEESDDDDDDSEEEEEEESDDDDVSSILMWPSPVWIMWTWKLPRPRASRFPMPPAIPMRLCRNSSSA